MARGRRKTIWDRAQEIAPQPDFDAPEDETNSWMRRIREVETELRSKTLTAQMRRYNATQPGRCKIPEWAICLFRDTEKRANTKGVEFTLTPLDIAEMTGNATRCAVTGIAFSFQKQHGAYRRPFAPSVDRIRPTLGYVKGNVRLVCTMANIAMNEWGENVLRDFITRANLGPAD